MRVMLLGDVHGNMITGRQAIQHARDNRAEKIVWAGDCGLWPGIGGLDFLDEVNYFSRRANIPNYWIGGNHEWWDEWIRVVRTGPADRHGFKHLRSHILLAPRIHSWVWAKKNFASAAGAASIDRKWRVEGKSWWPQEQLSDEEVNGAMVKFRNVKPDYLITHDASNYTPWGFSLVPDPDSQEHRRKIDNILRAATPPMHFHGHMHHRYEWENVCSNPNAVIKTIGLDCDGTLDNWGILDTETDEFKWRGTEKAFA